MIHWFANVGDTQPHVDAYITHTCDMQMEASLKQPRHIYIYYYNYHHYCCYILLFYIFLYYIIGQEHWRFMKH